MEIGGLGLVVVLISIFVLGNPRKLLLVAVFFAPFCASSVLSFSSFFLQPGHYFLFCLIGVSFVLLMCSGGIMKIVLPNKLLFGFVLIAFLSIVLAWLFRIDVLVYGIGNNNQLKSSLVTIQNFTQYLYLILGFIMYCFVFNFCIKSFENWKIIIRVMGISGIIVLMIGIYQVIANTYGLPYDEIFRNSVKDMWQTKERVQATMGEASFIGQYCTYLVSIYYGYKWINKRVVFYSAAILVIVIGVMSRSSTFLFGTIMVFIMIGVLQRKNIANLSKSFAVILIGSIIMVYLIQYNQYFQKLINSAIQKLTLESYSGVERSNIFSYMIKVGFSYPVFGIGYGGGRATDLYANLLSTTGFLGIVCFMMFVLKDLIILLKNKNKEGVLSCIALISGFLVTSCSMPDLTYLPIWIIFGLIDSRCYQINKEVRLY